MEHLLFRHVNCQIKGCPICSGTTKICLTCNGAKSDKDNTLTTECCGERLTEEKRKKIRRGVLDFRKGRWFDAEIGPTLAESANLELGDTFTHKSEKTKYILIGSYLNSLSNRVYVFHEVVNGENKGQGLGCLSFIHVKPFEKIFGAVNELSKCTDCC